jgi:hypothetical protein
MTTWGATENFNSAFLRSRGEYFSWLAHDDAYAPTFIERGVDVLRARKEVVACFSDVLVVDAHDSPIDQIDLNALRTDSPRVSERLHDILLAHHDCLPVFAVIRREALARTMLIAPYANGDQLLLAQLALIGHLHVARERLFMSRRHEMQSNKRFSVWIDHHAYTRWFLGPGGQTTDALMPQWRLASSLASSLWSANLPPNEWPGSAKALARWLVRYRSLFVKDLAAAARARRGAVRQARRDVVAADREGLR